jgi:hypothetical protein
VADSFPRFVLFFVWPKHGTVCREPSPGCLGPGADLDTSLPGGHNVTAIPVPQTRWAGLQRNPSSAPWLPTQPTASPARLLLPTFWVPHCYSVLVVPSSPQTDLCVSSCHWPVSAPVSLLPPTFPGSCPPPGRHTVHHSVLGRWGQE